jgi:hypothetical protein
MALAVVVAATSTRARRPKSSGRVAAPRDSSVATPTPGPRPCWSCSARPTLSWWMRSRRSSTTARQPFPTGGISAPRRAAPVGDLMPPSDTDPGDYWMGAPRRRWNGRPASTWPASCACGDAAGSNSRVPGSN